MIAQKISQCSEVIDFLVGGGYRTDKTEGTIVLMPGIALGTSSPPWSPLGLEGARGGRGGRWWFLEAFPGLEPEGVGELLPAVGGGA